MMEILLTILAIIWFFGGLSQLAVLVKAMDSGLIETIHGSWWPPVFVFIFLTWPFWFFYWKA